MKTIIARLMVAAVLFTGSSLIVGCGETKPEPKKETPKTPEMKKDEKKDK